MSLNDEKDNERKVELGWEHKFLKHRDPITLEVMLDEQGETGWELVAVYFHPEGQTHAFMRRRIVT